MADALFACTKCFKRFRLNELSKDHQLCSSCSMSRQKQCKYCRNDFKPKSHNDDERCPKCIEQEAKHGPPKPCEICKLKMAFKIALCVRCYHYKKKHGEPHECEHCRNRCAFKRDAASMAKINNHVLCWMCTYTYKKGRGKLEEELQEGSRKRGRDELLGDTDDDIDALLESRLGSKTKPAGSSQQDLSSAASSKRPKQMKTGGAGANTTAMLRSVTAPDLLTRALVTLPPATGGTLAQEPLGRPSTPTSSFPGSGLGAHTGAYRFDPPSDQMALINQLQEEVKSFKKQVSQKEAQLLEKERQITELKAEKYEMDKQWRIKEANTAKKHQEQLEKEMIKVRDLQRQLAAGSKTTKRTASNQRGASPLFTS